MEEKRAEEPTQLADDFGGEVRSKAGNSANIQDGVSEKGQVRGDTKEREREARKFINKPIALDYYMHTTKKM